MSWNFKVVGETKRGVLAGIAREPSVADHKYCPPSVVNVLNAAVDAFCNAAGRDIMVSTYGHMDVDDAGVALDKTGQSFNISICHVDRKVVEEGKEEAKE